METLLYKPLFINPQAYYVFPNINGRLEPKIGSGKEPAIFVGNIEVKTIAHGDIGKKQYFYNTNEIDLSAFSNSLVRISLYTSRGNVVLGEWNLDVVEGESEDYIDPEILDSLCGVWIADQNTNESESRNIIKNKIADRGGDLELLNFGYKLNSGYGKYEVDFTIFNDITDCTIIGNKIINHSEVLFKAQYNYEIKRIDVESFNAKVENITKGYIGYTYRDNNGIEKSVSFTPETIKANNGIITLPKSYNTLENSTGVLGGLYGYGVDKGTIITQIPSFEGALVTDGKDDLITSIKTVQEMLGGSNEITVVSMMANLDSRQIMCNSNFSNTNGYNVRNTLEPNGVISMLGYTDKNGTTNNLNLIMGDKNSIKLVDKVNFNSDYVFHPSSYNTTSFKTAWYWTIIANKVLTTDQINQVISYFNLDKHVKPDVYYDVKKQGLSNDTPEADWYLKDFSGNGHDMQLYNFAKKLGSGIGKYEADYSTWTKTAGVISTPFGFKITEPTHNYWLLYTSNITVPAHKVEISGIPEGGEFRYLGVHILKNGINELSKMEENSSAIGFTLSRGTTQPNDWVGLSVEQIPDYEGALVSDGVEDYGKVENLPIYKDYTVVADREIIDGLAENADGGVALKGESTIANSFIFDFNNEVYSFAKGNSKTVDTERFISYQSKYVNNGVNIDVGTGDDTDVLYLAKLGKSDRYSKLALWSFLLFPYSLSEFLIERQLKRYKLGTLYPDMVEFIPIINVNIGKTYNVFEIRRTDTNELLYYYINGSAPNNKIGSYLPKGTNIRILVKWDNNRADVTQIKFNGKEYELNRLSDNSYYIDVTLDKSPQKIDIYADEYIRYEDMVKLSLAEIS